MMFSEYFALTLLLLTLSACVSTKPDASRPQKPVRVISVPDTTEVEAASTARRSSASTDLTDRAAKAIDDKNYQQASRLLDRALRIDARDPETWYEYARLNFLNDDSTRARQMIDKSLSLNPGPELKQKIEVLKSSIDHVPQQSFGLLITNPSV